MIKDGSEILEKAFFGDSSASFGLKDGRPIVVEKELKLNLVHLTAVSPQVTTTKEALLEIEKFKKMIHQQPRLRLVTNQKELSKVSKVVTDGQIAVILGMQNTPSDILGSDINNKDSILALREAGISVMAPCYDTTNILGSGCLHTDTGLTYEGKIFLTRCAENGIIVNLAGCGHRMARDIVEYKKSGLKFNLMASQTGCYSQYRHIRNLPDDVLKSVAELGGIVGISMTTYTNDESDNSGFPFKKHLNHARLLCGEKSVCVGSGNTYITQTDEDSRKRFELMRPVIDPHKTLGARFPEIPLKISGPEMMKILCEFSFPYLPNDVWGGIFGKNLLDFFSGALPS